MVELDHRAKSIMNETGLDAFTRDALALLQSFWRGKWIIASAVLLALAIATTFILLSTPLYLSKAQLLIDPRAKQVLQTEVVPTGLGSSAAGADSLLVDSQVQIVESDSVLRQVIADNGLDRDPEFARGGGLGPLGRLRDALGYNPPIGTPVDLALERLRRLMQVKRLGNTYVIEIGVLSRDAPKAALIANAIAEAFLSDQSSATSSSTKETTETLVGRLSALRQDVLQAEQAVEDYRKANHLIDAQGVLLDEQRLQDLNIRLNAARTRRDEAQSRYDQARRMALRGAGAASTADGLDSPAIVDLRESLVRFDRAHAKIVSELGPRHPDRRSFEAQRTAILQQLEREIGVTVERAKNALDLAKRDEAALAGDLEKVKTQTLTNNDAQVKLRALQRDADAARSVLEAVLARAKQSGEQEDLSTTNFRILSPAVAAFRVAYPPTLIVLAIALVGGLFLGCGLAWLSDRKRTQPVIWEFS